IGFDFLFFFSSRRRHTRFDCDWSSDVCSSDLDADAIRHLLGFLDVVRGEDDGDAGAAQAAYDLPHVLAQLDVDTGGGLVEKQNRSEERRVGKECRSRWAPEY